MSKCKNYKFAEGNIKGNLHDLGLVKNKKPWHQKHSPQEMKWWTGPHQNQKPLLGKSQVQDFPGPVVKTSHSQAFPGGLVVKDPPANAGVLGLIPGLGRSHMPQGN